MWAFQVTVGTVPPFQGTAIKIQIKICFCSSSWNSKWREHENRFHRIIRVRIEKWIYLMKIWKSNVSVGLNTFNALDYFKRFYGVSKSFGPKPTPLFKKKFHRFTLNLIYSYQKATKICKLQKHQHCYKQKHFKPEQK